MDNQNIEIQHAKQTIELLKLYIAAKTHEEKDSLLSKIRSVNPEAYIVLTQKNYAPLDLVAKIDTAIQLDQYRPKNMSIIQLATSDDLDYIGGEFSTFDINLSQMIKNKESPESIRNRFKQGLQNLYILSKQFGKYWIDELNKHEKLVKKAHKSNTKNTIDIYQELFNVLTDDFCKKHKCKIETKIVTDWETSDVKPIGDLKIINACSQRVYTISISSDVPEYKKEKILKEFYKNPAVYPGAFPQTLIRVNITVIKNNHPEPNDFFHKMLAIFVHEIHHALDIEQPRHGAIGPQIEKIDKNTYVQYITNANAYAASATEISSYTIENEFFNRLKNSRF